MVDAYLLMLALPDIKIAGKIYNVGFENYSLDEIAGMVVKTLGDPSIVIEHKPTNDLRSYKVSSEKIYRELGFKATHTVQEAISDIASAYKSGKLPDPTGKLEYYNIKTMQEKKLE
jgi:nucleoside-diphosphate-sugar epimerase